MKRRVLAPFAALVLAPASFAQPVGDPTVFATKSGAKYHAAMCSSARKSKIAVKFSQAKAEGLTACKKCKPAR